MRTTKRATQYNSTALEATIGRKRSTYLCLKTQCSNGSSNNDTPASLYQKHDLDDGKGMTANDGSNVLGEHLQYHTPP